MKPILIVITAVALLGIAGCTVINYPNQQTQTQQSQLQTRQVQQREYDTNDVKLVMKAVLNTLQDDGFIVKNAVVDLGLLSASKEIALNSSTASNPASGVSDDFWAALFRDAVFGTRRRNSQPSTGTQQQQRVQNVKQIEATVNVSDFGKQTRVRASFQARILDTQGNIMETYPIDDAKFYQEFFTKISKGVFLEKQKF
ncbi:MAG: hypothetical protein JNL32_10015 [Candidatus Kapabacteria bacterium]|nr:hypothetical protein [Candidatus Kapabacteria bacterium]